MSITIDAVEQLALKVEEAAGSTEEGVRYFIEPAPGTLKRAIAKRHHIIFGRRGSGKSSLLRKAGADLTIDRRPIALVNLETFKSHSYPDVLLSVLMATFQKFDEWLETAAINPVTKTSFWKTLFGTKPSRPAFNRLQCEALSKRLKQQISQLETQLHSVDDAVTLTKDIKTEDNNVSVIDGKIEAKLSSLTASASSRLGSEQKSAQTDNVQEKYKRQKVDFLYRHIMEYQQIFRDIAKISGGDLTYPLISNDLEKSAERPAF